MNKKKIATSVAAVATAAALLLGGTFAWQGISQTALNEACDIVNPGGRLHDDFDGSNKNVYVENFADDEIFARVRFDEYFEIIMNYGGDAQKSEVVTVNATRNNTSTYVTHQFDEANATDAYWNWTMGDKDSETAYYMPTFNLNKDSLAADVNGVFDGANFDITDQDHNQYAKYVDYSDPDNAQKTGYEIYDGDTNKVDELSRDKGVLRDLNAAVNDIIDTGVITGYENNLVLSKEKVSHTAAQVNATNGFISMADWLALNNGTYSEETHGGYWVYDTDGWCYWSSPIPAGKTTGLLLDGIALDGVMDDTWYYAINVVGQFVTANDAGKPAEGEAGTGFYDTTAGTAPTAEAETLLENIGVQLSGENGGDDAPAADGWYNEVDKMTAGTTETVEIDGIKWFVLAKNDGKALLQAAQPVGNIPVQIAYEYGSTVDYSDHDIDKWLNSSTEKSYPIYTGTPSVATDFLDGFLVEKPNLVKYSVNNTIYTIDLFSTEGNRNTSVVYEELSRKVFIPTVADFASINYTTAVPGDAAKDRTYGSSGLITKEMADIMLGNTNAAFITTRTSPTELSNPLAYGSATWSLMTVTSNEGALTTGGVGAETAVDVFPMLWLDYATAIKDNPASGGDDSGSEEESVEFTVAVAREDFATINLLDISPMVVFTATYGEETIAVDKLSCKVKADGSVIAEATDLIGEGNMYGFDVTDMIDDGLLEANRTYDIEVVYTDGDISVSDTFQINTTRPTLTLSTNASETATLTYGDLTDLLVDGGKNFAVMLSGATGESVDSSMGKLKTILNSIVGVSVDGEYTANEWVLRHGNDCEWTYAADIVNGENFVGEINFVVTFNSETFAVENVLMSSMVNFSEAVTITVVGSENTCSATFITQ